MSRIAEARHEIAVEREVGEAVDKVLALLSEYDDAVSDRVLARLLALTGEAPVSRGLEIPPAPGRVIALRQASPKWTAGDVPATFMPGFARMVKRTGMPADGLAIRIQKWVAHAGEVDVGAALDLVAQGEGAMDEVRFVEQCLGIHDKVEKGA